MCQIFDKLSFLIVSAQYGVQYEVHALIVQTSRTYPEHACQICVGRICVYSQLV